MEQHCQVILSFAWSHSSADFLSYFLTPSFLPKTGMKHVCVNIKSFPSLLFLILSISSQPSLSFSY